MAASDRSSVRPPWTALETLRPLTLRACRRIVVIAPHPRDEIRAAGGLLHRLAARHASVDVLSLTDLPTRTCTPPSGTPVVPTPPPTGGRTVLLGSDGAGVAGPYGLVGGGEPAGAQGLVRLDELDRLVLPEETDGAGDGSWDDGSWDDGSWDDGSWDDGSWDDGGDDAAGAGRDDRIAADAYHALGLWSVRRHRLGLADGGVARGEADVVGAISEIVGFAAEEPSGLCVLAPWSGDGDDDHEAAGRAAEVVTAAYRVRLVRWLDRAWTWAGPESSEVPWRRARQVALSETALARKLAAGAAFGDRPGHDLELPDGSAPGPREVFLV